MTAVITVPGVVARFLSKVDSSGGPDACHGWTASKTPLGQRGRANLEGLTLGRVKGKTLGAYRTGAELCGTIRGYSRHLRHGEATCQPCRDAIAAYQRDRRGRR